MGQQWDHKQGYDCNKLCGCWLRQRGLKLYLKVRLTGLANEFGVGCERQMGIVADLKAFDWRNWVCNEAI